VQFWDGYKGSSFLELIAIDHAHLKPDLGGLLTQASAAPLVPHGTTCISLRYADGALLAADRLATMGYQVASREIEKLWVTDQSSVMAIAGAAGPAIEMARLIAIQFEHREKIEGEPLELEGKANTLSQLIRQNLPAAMQGLAVVPLFAGYDARRKTGRVWKYEITGGRYEEREYESIGSGSLFARESLKKSFMPEATRADALLMAVEALKDAADEDRATGGVDLERGIYPRVKTCTVRGVEDISDEEIAQAYQRVLERRRRPRG
jgi:proteasome beta subunit